MVQESKCLYIEVCGSGCSWILELGIEDARTAFACLPWLCPVKGWCLPKHRLWLQSFSDLTTSVAATLGCFRLSHRLSTMFFRSRLNFVLCLDSGVGKPDAVGPHPDLEAPFHTCTLQAPAAHAVCTAFT